MKSSPRRENVLHALHHLPRKMLTVHDSRDGAAFVLHELCHPGCFNLHKAAYLVNNPDFDCLQGVAGIAQDESNFMHEISWEKPNEFSSYIQDSPFHKQVCQVEAQALGSKASEEDAIKEIAQSLGFKHPDFYRWDLKHDNHGILLFERPDNHEEQEDLMRNSVYFLSFCPIS